MPVRFGVTPAKAIRDRRVNDAMLRTLSAIGMYANEDGWCWPSQTTVAEDTGKTRQTVNEHIAKLVEFGYLEKQNRFDKDGGQTSSMYRVICDFSTPLSANTTTPPVVQLADTNTPMNTPSNIPLSIENAIYVGQPITQLPKDNEMLKVAEVTAKKIKNYQAAIDLLMAFQKTRGIVLLYEDQKTNKAATQQLISAGVKPKHVEEAVRKAAKEGWACTNMFSIKKTAIQFANPMPDNKPKKFTADTSAEEYVE